LLRLNRRGAACCALLGARGRAGPGKPASTGLSAGFDAAQDRPFEFPQDRLRLGSGGISKRGYQKGGPLFHAQDRGYRRVEICGSGSVCQRSFTELVLRLFAESTLSRIRSFALLRMTGSEGFRMTCEGPGVTVEGFRMTSLSSVILEPFGPERASRAGSAKGKNLNSCHALGRKSRNDPLRAPRAP
jgi:hypothetical protein